MRGVSKYTALYTWFCLFLSYLLSGYLYTAIVSQVDPLTF
jgi:hypothetical protein